ncbi:synaptotagmin-4-like [Limulus polyphemus]|uniref:Synaptotagmin-4-like n=1 Tax=Limulus polyphemus TaxID=6850 RepID=A0ABM1C0I6_LIMPO|nr:synaptotagmin-4-like [Limulus polyphemus]
MPTLVGICIGSAFFVFTLAAVTCYCYRRKTLQVAHKLCFIFKKNVQEKPVVLRKPTALKTPSSGPRGFKKSSSPTNQNTLPFDKPSSNSQNVDRGNTDSLKNHSSSSHECKHLIPKCHIKNENENHCSHVKKEKERKEREKKIIDEKDSKLGKLHFRLKYAPEKHSLLVTIVQCTQLPPKDLNRGTSDPYVKLLLLPDKQHKVKTRVLRKTLHPKYDEEFTFYGITPNQLEATTLHFVVLSFDRYSRDDIIGEVIYSFQNTDFEDLEKEITLTKEIAPRTLNLRSHGRGELQVSLCYQPAARRLTVVVLKARNLPKVNVTGISDPYVKLYLLYKNQRIAKKKTHVKKRTVNPVFNESFVFNVPNDGLECIGLEFFVLDWDCVTKNEVVGRLVLGSRVGGAAQHHWHEVSNSPRRQIAEWHKLRE